MCTSWPTAEATGFELGATAAAGLLALLGLHFMCSAPRLARGGFKALLAKNDEFRALTMPQTLVEVGQYPNPQPKPFLETKAFLATVAVCAHAVFLLGTALFALGLLCVGLAVPGFPSALAAAPAVTAVFVTMVQMRFLQGGMTGVRGLGLFSGRPTTLALWTAFLGVTVNVGFQAYHSYFRGPHAPFDQMDSTCHRGYFANRDTDSASDLQQARRNTQTLAALYGVAVFLPALIGVKHRQTGWLELGQERHGQGLQADALVAEAAIRAAEEAAAEKLPAQTGGAETPRPRTPAWGFKDASTQSPAPFARPEARSPGRFDSPAGIPQPRY